MGDFLTNVEIGIPRQSPVSPEYFRHYLHLSVLVLRGQLGEDGAAGGAVGGRRGQGGRAGAVEELAGAVGHPAFVPVEIACEERFPLSDHTEPATKNGLHNTIVLHFTENIT